MNKFLQQKSDNARSVRNIKLCSAACLGMGLIVVSTFSSLYWELYQRTLEYDLQDPADFSAQPELLPLDYNHCNVGKPADANDVWLDSNWSFVFYFNAVFYTVTTGMVICSCMGLIYTRIFNATLNCLLLAIFAHIVAIVLAGVYRFRQSGQDCALEDDEYDTLGNSWETDALMFKNLFIAQCALFVPFSLCACFGMKQGKELGPKHADDNFVRDY